MEEAEGQERVGEGTSPMRFMADGDLNGGEKRERELG